MVKGLLILIAAMITISASDFCNTMLLERNADTFYNRIVNKITSDQTMIEGDLDFLWNGDAKEVEQYKSIEKFTVLCNQIPEKNLDLFDAKQKGAYHDFLNQCEAIYNKNPSQRIAEQEKKNEQEIKELEDCFQGITWTTTKEQAAYDELIKESRENCEAKTIELKKRINRIKPSVCMLLERVNKKMLDHINWLAKNTLQKPLENNILPLKAETKISEHKGSNDSTNSQSSEGLKQQ